jgi:hypothetical protein
MNKFEGLCKNLIGRTFKMMIHSSVQLKTVSKYDKQLTKINNALTDKGKKLTSTEKGNMMLNITPL